MEKNRTSVETSVLHSPAVWMLALVSLATAIILGYLTDIRFDEAYTLDTTSRGVAYAFRQAIGFEQQAPLYFVALSVWREANSSIFFARLFSIICVPFIVWASAAASKRYLAEVSPVFAAAVAAFSSQSLWSALEIRLYALMALISAVLFVFFYDAYLTDKPTTRSRILFIIVAILALYTQYFLGFQLVAGGIALIATARWRGLLRYAIDCAVAGILFAPMIFVVIGQTAAVGSQAAEPGTPGQAMSFVYQSAVALLMSVEWITAELMKRWFVRVVLVIIAILFARRLLVRRSPAEVALAVMAIVLLVCFLVAAYGLGDVGLHKRHMASLILPLTLIPLTAFASVRNRGALFGWVALILGLNIAQSYDTNRTLSKPGDMRRSAEYVMANENENQPVLVFHADAVLPLSHYYKGKNQLVALPRQNTFDAWNPRNNVIESDAQIAEIIERLPGSPERFWLIDDHWCAQGAFRYNCEILEKFVADNFETEREIEMAKPVTIRLLRRGTSSR